MKNVLTFRRMARLAAIVATIGFVVASCDNATTTNNDTVTVDRWQAPAARGMLSAGISHTVELCEIAF